MTFYRDRIYGAYVSARSDVWSTDSLEGFGSRATYLRRLIRLHFPKERSARILDLGCGHGAVLQFIREAGYADSKGVDVSPEQVAAARELGIAGVKEGNIMDALTQEADASVDVILTFDVIEHFKRDELINLTNAIHRVLRKGGRWIIHVPNGESPFFGRIRYGDFTHELAFTRSSLSQILFGCGFHEVSCFEDAPVVHGAKSAVRAVLWWMIRQIWLIYLVVETGVFDRKAMFTQNFLAIAVKD